MQNITPHTKWKSVFRVALIMFFLYVKITAQTPVVMKVDTTFKHVNDANIIYYTSDSLRLKGYLYKPKAKGQFPVYIWIHGAGFIDDTDQNLVNYWVKHGFIFFVPIRRGISDNPGKCICDEEKEIRRRKEMEQLKFRQIYALDKKANEDVFAALNWIKKQPYVDTNNIVIAGADYGAIQVLITAEKDGQSPLGTKSFIAFFPAFSSSWDSMWGDSLKQSINIAKRPVFLFQERIDLHPSLYDSVGPVLNKKQFPNRYKTFPAIERSEGFEIIPNVWGKEVLKYLKDCGVKGKK
jgi:dienelactone hydrolase